ncbi:MAG: HAMP domain-containing protein [Hyphomonadaceae bacterium]|nr:HAMP domain-containing protein [Hyphomonadaceae bacterium]
MSDAEAPAKSGLPIAAHLAVLVAIALAAAYVVNLTAVVMLPPRPPDVMRGDKVLDAFTAGYAVAKTGRTPASGEGARWSIEKQKPRATRGPRAGRIIVNDLARRLDTDPSKVLVAFDATPTDVVVFRVRSEEFRVERMERERAHAESEAMREAVEKSRLESEKLRAEVEARRAEVEQRRQELERRSKDVEARRLEAERLLAEAEQRRDEAEKRRQAHARTREMQTSREMRRQVVVGPDGVVRVLRPTSEGPKFVTPEPPATPAPPAPPQASTKRAPAPLPPLAPLAPAEPPEPPRFAPPPPGVVLMSGFLVAAELADGRWLVMRQQSSAETFDWIMRAALGIGATLAILLLLALLFARRLAAPIQRFAEAARRVGVDVGEAPVKEEGPRELRTAARAVNAMQGRLRSLVAERTEMLAAVAHDLRTPLMRLRLAAENADPALRERLAKETGEIDAMVSSFIAFARDDPTREARVKLDLAALLQSVADDRAATGQAVTYEGPDRLVVMGQPVGLKRLVENLIDNAVKYGGAARVTMRQDGGDACIEVADDGPGVPREEREKVFRPFVRGEGATGAGAGLGLAAAREIARAHGGDVDIRDGQPKGALVRATLPV